MITVGKVCDMILGRLLIIKLIKNKEISSLQALSFSN